MSIEMWRYVDFDMPENGETVEIQTDRSKRCLARYVEKPEMWVMEDGRVYDGVVFKWKRVKKSAVSARKTNAVPVRIDSGTNVYRKR